MRLILCLTALAAGPALAQAPATPAARAPEPAQPPAADPALPPTLSITAHIEARSIRVQQRSDGEVGIWAEPGGKGEWTFDRHGIPDPIPLGKTLNNVAFDLDAHATIDDRGVTVGASVAPGEMTRQPPPSPQ